MSGKIQTGWSNKSYHMLQNQDGSIILCRGADQSDYSSKAPISVLNSVQRKKIGELKRDGVFRIEPEASILSEDGKTFVTAAEVNMILKSAFVGRYFPFRFCLRMINRSLPLKDGKNESLKKSPYLSLQTTTSCCFIFSLQDHQSFEIWDVHKQVLRKTVNLNIVEDDYLSLRSLSATSKGGYVLVSLQGMLHDNLSVMVRLLGVYDLASGTEIAKLPIYGNPFSFQISDDCNVLMTNVRPENEIVRSLDFYDVSQLKNKAEMKKIASFKPETDARFAYLSRDGKALCVGLPNVDGVTFFTPCSKK